MGEKDQAQTEKLESTLHRQLFRSNFIIRSNWFSKDKINNLHYFSIKVYTLQFYQHSNLSKIAMHKQNFSWTSSIQFVLPAILSYSISNVFCVWQIKEEAKQTSL